LIVRTLRLARHFAIPLRVITPRVDEVENAVAASIAQVHASGHVALLIVGEKRTDARYSIRSSLPQRG
jgi:hypothetical protein